MARYMISVYNYSKLKCASYGNIYIYIYMCVCVCVCEHRQTKREIISKGEKVREKVREREIKRERERVSERVRERASERERERESMGVQFGVLWRKTAGSDFNVCCWTSLSPTSTLDNSHLKIKLSNVYFLVLMLWPHADRSVKSLLDGCRGLNHQLPSHND